MGVRCRRASPRRPERHDGVLRPAVRAPRRACAAASPAPTRGARSSIRPTCRPAPSTKVPSPSSSTRASGRLVLLAGAGSLHTVYGYPQPLGADHGRGRRAGGDRRPAARRPVAARSGRRAGSAPARAAPARRRARDLRHRPRLRPHGSLRRFGALDGASRPARGEQRRGRRRPSRLRPDVPARDGRHGRRRPVSLQRCVHGRDGVGRRLPGHRDATPTASRLPRSS